MPGGTVRSVTTRLTDLLPLIAGLQAEPDADARLTVLAERTGLSPTHLQRVFSRMVGESPKAIASRIVLDRATAALTTTRESVLEIALASGFDSHEGFTRAFRRHYGLSPSEYRARGLAGIDTTSIERAAAHRTLVQHAAPCVGLVGVRLEPQAEETREIGYEFERRELGESHILFMRKRVPPSGIADALAELIPGAYGHAMKSGATLASPPFCRYREVNQAGLTLEAGVGVAVAAEGEGDVLAGDAIPAGPVVTTIHCGAVRPIERSLRGPGSVDRGARAEDGG